MSSSNQPLTPNPGKVLHFIRHVVKKNGQSIPHVFEKVEWFLDDQNDLKWYLGKPIEVWDKTLSYPHGPASFLPVQRIKSKFIRFFCKIRGKNVMVVLPRDRNIAI